MAKNKDNQAKKKTKSKGQAPASIADMEVAEEITASKKKR